MNDLQKGLTLIRNNPEAVEAAGVAENAPTEPVMDNGPWSWSADLIARRAAAEQEQQQPLSPEQSLAIHQGQDWRNVRASIRLPQPVAPSDESPEGFFSRIASES